MGTPEHRSLIFLQPQAKSVPPYNFGPSGPHRAPWGPRAPYGPHLDMSGAYLDMSGAYLDISGAYIEISGAYLDVGCK